MIKNLRDFVSKSSIRLGLNGVLVTPDEIVATDTFKLIEMKIVNQVKEPIIVAVPEGYKTIHSVLNDKLYVDGKGHYVPVTTINGQFPEYKGIIRDLKNPITTIRLSATHLEAIAKAFTTTKSSMVNDYIDVEIFSKKYDPVKFTRGPITALLMPEIKD